MGSPHRDQETPRATMSPLPGWLSACLVAGTFLTLAFLERRRPLRRAVEPALQRTGRNLAIAGLGAIAVQLAEMPIVGRVSRGRGARPLGRTTGHADPLGSDPARPTALTDAGAETLPASTPALRSSSPYSAIPDTASRPFRHARTFIM